MWNNFCAVVEDLFWFALGVELTAQPIVPKAVPLSLPPLPQTTMGLLSSAPAPMLLAKKIPLPELAQHAHSTPAIPKSEPAEETMYSTAILHAPVVMYVCAQGGTACLHSPQMDFDTVIETLPYGTAVTVIGYQGRFASVNRSNITGWVAKDDISPQKNDVWPQYMPGTLYDEAHTETQKTRQIINDMFGAGNLGLPLQAGEYIITRLKSEHRTIAWSRKRPRAAGAWATLLRGTLGIHSGVTPKTDSVIEWQSERGEGRLGYIEAVTPDLTITVSAVGADEAGRYSVKSMTEEVWRELRPVFIEVA